ncbi:MAG: SIMPL domain-containing protein, partial [Chloroflexota bacterium]
KTLGIAEKDTKTASYRIEPQYAYDKGEAPRITGYQAVQLVTLTLRKVDDAGKALDALVRNDGATNATIRFTLEDTKPSQAEARKLAIEDARAKAEAMARTAGVRLGKVLSISDTGSSAPPSSEQRLAFAAPAPKADTQIPVGDLEVVVRVQVQFAIE